jgi:hypothetical protein
MYCMHSGVVIYIMLCACMYISFIVHTYWYNMLILLFVNTDNVLSIVTMFALTFTRSGYMGLTECMYIRTVCMLYVQYVCPTIEALKMCHISYYTHTV